MNAEVDETPEDAVLPIRNIALCLSGGGLRAALFHFGLLKALGTHSRDGRTALSSIREIYSVSGGSLIAAHLVVRWTDYNDSERVAELEADVLDFVGRNVRDRVIRRWMLSRIGHYLAFGWLFRWLRKLGPNRPRDAGLSLKPRAYWLQREYEELVERDSFANCYAKPGEHRPSILHILATSFTTGELCSFTSENFQIEPNFSLDAKEQEQSHSAYAGHIPLAYAVAASSAFPPLFPPVALTAEMLRQPEDRYFQETIHLSDGGVFDNLGLTKFRATHANAKAKATCLILSNAGGAFHAALGETYSGVISRNVRASDILMRRVAAMTETPDSKALKLKVIDVRIGAHVADLVLMPATQRLLRLVRTDLDRFDRRLATLLIDHGYRVASAQLSAAGWTGPHPPIAPLTASSDAEAADIAAKATRRSFRSLWFDRQDLWRALVVSSITALVLATPLFLLTGILGSAWASREAYLAAEEKAEALELEKHASLSQRNAHIVAFNHQAKQLERVRTAVASGDMEAVRRALAISIQQSERLAEDPTAAGSPVQLNEPDVVSQIIDERPSYSISPPAASYDQRVYIQFAGVLTRAQITALNASLKSAGWRAQGTSGERTKVAAGLHEVRFSGTNGAAATALARALNESKIIPNEVTPQAVPIVERDVLEVWISR